MSEKRKSPCLKYPKKSRSISFVGEDSHSMLEFFDIEGEKFLYGKSGLVIELLKIYKDALELYGEDAIFKVRCKIEMEKESKK